MIPPRRAKRLGVIAAVAASLVFACDPGGRRGERELAQVVDELLPAVVRLSGLEQAAPVKYARKNSDQIRAFVEEQLERELPREELRSLSAAYALLGLIPDTLDLRALLLDLYTEQIIGYYDPERKTLFVATGVSRSDFRTVVAHELVHALQDQHADLLALISGERGNDRQTAAQAALEGQAVLVMLALSAEEQSGGRIDPRALPDPAVSMRAAIAAPETQPPVLRRSPRVIRETLLFPYSEGASFVQALWRAYGGPVAPLDSLLPQSTEQVLSPLDRFIRYRDAPTELAFANAAGAYENTVGRFELGILLSQQLGAGADSLANGWDGDRYRVEVTGDRMGLVWWTIWDDEQSADAFATAIGSIGDRFLRGGSIEESRVEGRPAVRVTIGGPGDSSNELPVTIVVTDRVR